MGPKPVYACGCHNARRRLKNSYPSACPNRWEYCAIGKYKVTVGTVRRWASPHVLSSVPGPWRRGLWSISTFWRLLSKARLSSEIGSVLFQSFCSPNTTIPNSFIDNFCLVETLILTGNSGVTAGQPSSAVAIRLKICTLSDAQRAIFRISEH